MSYLRPQLIIYNKRSLYWLCVTCIDLGTLVKLENTFTLIEYYIAYYRVSQKFLNGDIYFLTIED